MKTLYSNTLVTVSADISRGANSMTWAELTALIGRDAPEYAAIEHSLMHDEVHNMDGVLIHRADYAPPET